MERDKSTIKANFKNAKVLIVEDNDDQWAIIKRVMAQHFSEVMVQRVASTEEALSLMVSWQRQEWDLPKLILLDLYMPSSSDGWQLLTQIKAMAAPPAPGTGSYADLLDGSGGHCGIVSTRGFGVYGQANQFRGVARLI